MYIFFKYIVHFFDIASVFPGDYTERTISAVCFLKKMGYKK